MILSTIAMLNAESKARALSAPRQPGVLAPINPIILVHGLFGFDTFFGITDYWKDVPEALRAAGAREVYVARVSATSAVETRAAELAGQINRKYPGRSVHLIGHSMGGLDCRYLTTHLSKACAFTVLSVSTFATPHRGSPAADLVATIHIADIPAFVGIVNLFPSGDGDGKACASLTTSSCRTFNACTPDVPGVRYFSWGASFTPGIIDSLTWGAPFHCILATEGSNDGVVSVSSAKWGEYLGTIQNVDHTEIIGHKFTQTRPGDILSFLGGQAPFDHKKLYVEHANMLAKEVEGQSYVPRFYNGQGQYYKGQSQYYQAQGQNHGAQSYLQGAALSSSGY